MRLKAVQAFNTPKDARTITQVHVFIFDVRHTDTKSQLNTAESQLHSRRHRFSGNAVQFKVNPCNSK